MNAELKPISECKTVAELLADKSRWTQGTLARDKNGEECHECDATASCFCLIGAIYRVTHENFDLTNQLLQKLGHVIGRDNTAIFNDSHTYEEVMAKVLEAGI